MILTIILFVLGFALLIKGADILVDGAASLAKRSGLSTFFVGLTIVAFGTTAPELAVGVLASVRGESDIVIGNVIGSVIVNALLILGIAAVVAPLTVRRATITREVPFLALAALAVVFLVNDAALNGDSAGLLTRGDGLVLVCFFLIFIYYTFAISREEAGFFDRAVDETGETMLQLPFWRTGLMITGGLAASAVGGNWIVDGAMAFARYFQVSETLIGLTIVAVGTSLPELAAATVASYKGNADIAVGDIVGSNIYNLVWILGVSATVRPARFTPTLNIDLAIVLGVTLLLVALTYFGRRLVLGRVEGVVLIGSYVAYLMFLIFRG